MSKDQNTRHAKPWDENDDGSLTHAFTLAELDKDGFAISKKPIESMNKGELLEMRNNLRRAANTYRAKAEAAAKKSDEQETTRWTMIMSEASRMANVVNSQLDMNELASEKSGYNDNQFRNADGRRIQLLGRNDRLADLNNSYRDTNDFGFGEYIAAMVRGTNDVSIKNALSEGTDSAGGYTVPKRLLSNVIDKMRAKSTVIQAGALTVPLDTQVTTIARIASDPAAGWRMENAAVAESDPTFEGVTFNARSLAVLVKVSRELLDDSVNIDQALTMAFAGAMAGEADRVALFGSGTAPEPRGVFNTTNINSVSMGANGAALTSYGKLLDFLYELELDNAGKPTAAIQHPRTWRTIQGFADTTNQPLQPPPALANLPQLVSTTVPINQTQGTANNASSVIVGDFSQLLIGIRQEMRIEILREAFASNLQYGFLCHLRMDVAVAHPESFCKLIGITP